MKKLSLLFAFALLCGVASASPYLVYAGYISGSNLSDSRTTSAATRIYVITDMTDTSNFAVLLVNGSGQYSVLGRPTDSPTTEEANNNFLASAGTNAVLCYSGEVSDSNNNTSVIRGYGTGGLVTHSTLLVASRTKPETVRIVTGRKLTGTYTFSTLSPSVYSGGVPFVKSISGAASGYILSSAGDLTTATTSGTLALNLDTGLTQLANIGGGYRINLSNTAVVMPVTVPNGTTVADAYAAWLSAFAQIKGYTSASANTFSDAAESYSGSSAFSGSSLSLNGTLDTNGAGLVDLGAGTLTVNSGTLNVNTVTLASSNEFSTVLTIGGLAAGTGTTTTTGSTITVNDPNNTGANLVLTVSSGSLTLGGVGTIGTGGTGLFPSPGQSQNLTGTLSFTTGNFLITAVNNDGTVDGTITSTSVGSLSNLIFTEATLTGDGATSGFAVSTAYTGTLSIQGGTITNTDNAYIFANSAITVTTAQ